jgi:hypothetical protein
MFTNMVVAARVNNYCSNGIGNILLVMPSTLYDRQFQALDTLSQHFEADFF